jgi:hypothetical protein
MDRIGGFSREVFLIGTLIQDEGDEGASERFQEGCCS